VFTIVAVIYAGNLLVEDKVFTVTTSPTVVSQIIPYNREYYLIINMSSDTFVYLASTPTINSANYLTLGCVPLFPYGGSFEDDFYVFKGTWYACVESGTAVVHVREKE